MRFGRVEGAEGAGLDRADLPDFARRQLLELDPEAEAVGLERMTQLARCVAHALLLPGGAGNPDRAPASVLVLGAQQEQGHPPEVIRVKVRDQDGFDLFP
jgi:hypothetical protein